MNAVRNYRLVMASALLVCVQTQDLTFAQQPSQYTKTVWRWGRPYTRHYGMETWGPHSAPRGYGVRRPVSRVPISHRHRCPHCNSQGCGCGETDGRTPYSGFINMQSQPWLVDGSSPGQGQGSDIAANQTMPRQSGNTSDDRTSQGQTGDPGTSDELPTTANDALPNYTDSGSALDNTLAQQGGGQVAAQSGNFSDRSQISDFFGGGGSTTVTFRPGIVGTFGVNSSGDALQLIEGSGLNPSARSFQPTGGGGFQTDSSNNIIELGGFSGQPTESDGGSYVAIPTGQQTYDNGSGDVTTDVYQIRRVTEETQVSSNASRINIGAVKISEGTSALPQDRVFFNYSYFDNTNLGPGGINVHRFTPGFEKTFNEGSSSFQFRFPFASTLDNNIFLEGMTDSSSLLVGDIHMAFKTKLIETDQWLLSTGVQWTIPTADDISFNVRTVPDESFNEFLRIETDSVHVLPFLAGMYVPQADDRFWLQGFLQFDFDVNGNPVLLNTIPEDTTVAFKQIGRWNEATFAYVDISAGYEVYRDPEGSIGGLTSFAPMFELHYNRSVTNPDHVTATDNELIVAQLGNPNANAVEVINLTVGMSAKWDNGTKLMLGFVTPVSGGNDREFDGELRVLLSKHFGPGGDTSSGDRFGRRGR